MTPAKVMLAAGLIMAVSFFSSFIHPWGNLRSGLSEYPEHSEILQGSHVPEDVRQVLETKCADCHSNNTHWPGYSHLAPGSWLMERDVFEGRKHLNLSNWQEYGAESQIDLLTEMATESRSGAMPVKQYTMLHRAARLTDADREMLYNWAKSERKRVKNQMAAQQEEGKTP